MPVEVVGFHEIAGAEVGFVKILIHPVGRRRRRFVNNRRNDLLQREQNAVIELCAGLRSVGALRATDAELAALAINVVMIATATVTDRYAAKGMLT